MFGKIFPEQGWHRAPCINTIDINDHQFVGARCSCDAGLKKARVTCFYFILYCFNPFARAPNDEMLAFASQLHETVWVLVHAGRQATLTCNIDRVGDWSCGVGCWVLRCLLVSTVIMSVISRKSGYLKKRD